jgi:hypothetical protein
MHTYEFICNGCGTKINMEIHKELDYNLYCPCGLKMTLVFYLKSLDVRGKVEDFTE